MPIRMAAQIRCHNREIEDTVILALVEHGFGIELLDWDVAYGGGPMFMARIITKLDTGAFADWVAAIVAAETSRAEVQQAGLEPERRELPFEWLAPQQPRCTSCGRPFEATRSDAAYCSSRCRQRAYRQRRVTVERQSRNGGNP
jgi:hypothetical protein